ncbi:TPA: hypothetical protein IUX93_001814 [Enterococcus faecalis]|uniref:hypothetical protein n=1 Tax=Enterococcus faecalis TaxID=1351 RepID=UPI0019DAA87A|nr:hypothetical protein [Enterococcus faecalis]EIT1920374.1 hypothetical protein [Enterococcus faecalis]HAP4914529.1 hypothetical protein [Enterococcus faecalis]HAP4920496.1 hypothetical protein [Enterococcus faecalis]
MKVLEEWLVKSIKSMEFVMDMLPGNNMGHIEAKIKKDTYEEVLEKVKKEPTSFADEVSH